MVECPTCQDTFDTTVGMKCHHATVHGESIAGVGVECDFCGSEVRVDEHELEENDTHFCNQECYSEWQSENRCGEAHPNWGRVELECDQCGSVFNRAKSKASDDRRQFCSEGCLTEWKQENMGPNLTTLTCDGCEEEFQVRECRADGRRFCSPECYSDWQDGQMPGHGVPESMRGENHPMWKGGLAETQCSGCGEEFELRPNRLEKYDRNFCSTACYGEFRSKHLTGPDAPNWGGGWKGYYGANWDKQRTAAKERDEYQCQDCGRPEPEDGPPHHVHHIAPRRDFMDENRVFDYETANQLENLVTLCPDCHPKWDSLPYLRPDTAPA